MRRGFLTRYYDGDDGQPQGGGAGDTGGTKPSDVLERYGRDALKLAEKLAEMTEDNYKLREKNRELRQERDGLKSKVAPDDARVLTAAEATAYDAYLALGAPDALMTALAERSDLAAQVARRTRQDQIAAAAKVADYDADVLATLVGDAPLSVKALGDGKDRKDVAYIRAGDNEIALTDHAAQAWAKFLPVLAPAQKPTGDGVGSPANGARPATPPELPRPRAMF